MCKHIQCNILFYLVFIIITSCFSACVSTKEIGYFHDIPDSTKLNYLKLSNYVSPVIHPDDVLSVTIQTTDATATTAVNALNNSSSSAATMGTDMTGYVVDSLGNIQIPVLGKIKVSNLTLAQARDIIDRKAKLYFVDPIIIVKNKSFKVTILGEVAKPGTFYITTPKANIIDLLSLAGDLNNYAKKDNILLLRKNDDNTLSSIRINLTNSNIIKSPYFYLQSNDVIYVEPNKIKAMSASDAVVSHNLTFISLGITVLTTLLLVFKK